MSTGFGKSLWLLLIASLMGLAGILLRNPPPLYDATIWLFADSNARALGPAVAKYEAGRAGQLRIETMNPSAMATRLMSLFMNGSGPTPDLVEIEVGSVGAYFRPPADQIGFLPLNDFLQRDGLIDRINPARLGMWSKEGRVFGIPLDVHPVAIAYRADLFEQAGIDLSTAITWRQFHEHCLAYENYWQTKGVDRYAVELPTARADVLLAMLQQQGINLIDETGQTHFLDPLVGRTIRFYAGMVAGPNQVGTPGSGGAGLWLRDFSEGTTGAILCADWRAEILRNSAPELTGKVRLMALPKFSPTDAPTATWGGTMVGIPRMVRDPEKSWQLLKDLYLSDAVIRARAAQTGIVPAIVSTIPTGTAFPVGGVVDPALPETRTFFTPDSIPFEYLAGQIPERHITPATGMAESYLAVVMNKAIDAIATSGDDSIIDSWLQMAERDLRDRMAQGAVN